MYLFIMGRLHSLQILILMFSILHVHGQFEASRDFLYNPWRNQPMTSQWTSYSSRQGENLNAPMAVTVSPPTNKIWQEMTLVQPVGMGSARSDWGEKFRSQWDEIDEQVHQSIGRELTQWKPTSKPSTNFYSPINYQAPVPVPMPVPIPTQGQVEMAQNYNSNSEEMDNRVMRSEEDMWRSRSPENDLGEDDPASVEMNQFNQRMSKDLSYEENYSMEQENGGQEENDHVTQNQFQNLNYPPQPAQTFIYSSSHQPQDFLLPQPQPPAKVPQMPQTAYGLTNSYRLNFVPFSNTQIGSRNGNFISAPIPTSPPVQVPTMNPIKDFFFYVYPTQSNFVNFNDNNNQKIHPGTKNWPVSSKGRLSLKDNLKFPDIKLIQTTTAPPPAARINLETRERKGFNLNGNLKLTNDNFNGALLPFRTNSRSINFEDESQSPIIRKMRAVIAEEMMKKNKKKEKKSKAHHSHFDKKSKLKNGNILIDLLVKLNDQEYSQNSDSNTKSMCQNWLPIKKIGKSHCPSSQNKNKRKGRRHF